MCLKGVCLSDFLLYPNDYHFQSVSFLPTTYVSCCIMPISTIRSNRLDLSYYVCTTKLRNNINVLLDLEPLTELHYRTSFLALASWVIGRADL